MSSWNGQTGFGCWRMDGRELEAPPQIEIATSKSCWKIEMVTLGWKWSIVSGYESAEYELEGYDGMAWDRSCNFPGTAHTYRIG